MALEKTRISTMEAFLKFEGFNKYIGEFKIPTFIFDFTTTLNQVEPLLLEKKS